MDSFTNWSVESISTMALRTTCRTMFRSEFPYLAWMCYHICTYCELKKLEYFTVALKSLNFSCAIFIWLFIHFSRRLGQLINLQLSPLLRHSPILSWRHRGKKRLQSCLRLLPYDISCSHFSILLIVPKEFKFIPFLETQRPQAWKEDRWVQFIPNLMKA